MVVNGRPLKRAKRRVTADLYDFLTFPDAAGDGAPLDLDGPFRSNVRAFLSRHARLPPPPSILSPSVAAHLLTWRIAFRIGDSEEGEEPPARAVVELDVVEEDVPRSRSVYCDQCRVVGWSGHPVCGKRYHFIIRKECSPAFGYHRACIRCGTMVHLLDSRCTSCNYELTSDDIEDGAYLLLEDPNNLLHGVVHANGYGHLLRVNGREGGSKFLTGCDIMSFWDRLCKMLHVRKVTVMDISKKHGMEYRLLHAVTTGRPWYGDWGYEFGAGSYALNAEAYQKAVQTLSNVPLSLFFSHARSPRTALQSKIALYWSLSDRQLVTVRDLFRYVTELLHDGHVRGRLPDSLAGRKEKFAEAASWVLCPWSREDVEQAENTVVRVLRAVGGLRWVTWRALRGAACRSVAPPELLDCCLNGLGGKPLNDGTVVAVRCNADTSAVEYRLEAASNQPLPVQLLCRPSTELLLCDLRFLYDALLSPPTMHRYRPQAIRDSSAVSATKLLDCKQFIKPYDESVPKLTPSNPFALRVWCHVELVDQPKDYTAPPPELVVLPATATVVDLKLEASKAFRETYLVFQRFHVEQLLDHEDASDSMPVKLLNGFNGAVRVSGRCHGDERGLWHFRMERGIENWIVDCACGAKDDDGERMLACDACGVWQHTRCAGISDYDEVPVKYVCTKCGASKTKGRLNGRYRDGSSNVRCKDETASPYINETGRYAHLTTVR